MSIDISKNHYKECTPEETIKTIQKILNDNDIEVEETINIQNETIDTHTIRLTLKGTNIGQNGKGVNETYCRASAYAEFIERLQNQFLYLDSGQAIPNKEYHFIVANDEKFLCSEDLIKSETGFMQNFFSKINFSNKTFKEKNKKFKELIIIDKLCRNVENQFLSLPFINFKTLKKEYIPYHILCQMYGSNGMAAGNTIYEAIVQGMSEIIERMVQKEIILNKICLPDIPDDYIKQFSQIYNMYKKLQTNQNYLVTLKDASLGGKYPVAALVIIDKTNGTYGVKFGCHPNFGIAMERCFTELTQGRSIESYAKLGKINFDNSFFQNKYNILTSFLNGKVQLPYEFFSDKSNYNFTPFYNNQNNISNKKMAEKLIFDFVNLGYDVLIRDVSILGFPSVMIVIPGISELLEMDDLQFRLYNTKTYLKLKFQNLESVTKHDCQYFITCFKLMEYYSDEYSINEHFKFMNNNFIPGEESGLGGLYLAVLCSIFCNEYEKAEYFMNIFYNNINKTNLNKEQINYYYAVKMYINALKTLKSHDEAIKYLNIFFTKSICDRIHYYFSEPDQILIKHYNYAVTNLNKNLIYWSIKLKDVIDNAYYTTSLKQDNLISLFER